MASLPALLPRRTGVLLSLCAGALAWAGTAAGAAPASAQLANADSGRGEQIYNSQCHDCHGQGKAHTPPTALLRYLPAGVIQKSLTRGTMRKEAEGMSEADITAVAQYLGQPPKPGFAAVPPPACTGRAAQFDFDAPPAFEFAGRDAGNRHFVPASLSGLSVRNVQRLRVKYAVGFPGASRARSQPALAGGAIYVGSHDGTVYALDRETGCLRWTFDAAAEVRNAVIVSPWAKGDRKARPLVYFGDLIGGLYAVDAVSGALAWRDVPDKHPSATLTAPPVLVGKRLYQAVASLEEVAAGADTYACCTFRGSVVAYDATSGKRLWQTYMTDPAVVQGKTAKGVDALGPSGAGIWSIPAVDLRRGQLLVTTGDNYTRPASAMSDSVVALDLETGRVRWHYQALAGDAWNMACMLDPQGPSCPEDEGPDFDFGAGPVLATASDGRDYVLAGQKSGWVYAVDPDDGQLRWKRRVGRGGLLGGVQFGMAADGDTLFVPVNDGEDPRPFDMPPQPGLYALDIRSGAFKWRSPNEENRCAGRPFCDSGLAANITVTPGLVFAGSGDGWLRAYDSRTGKVLWRFDTTQKFPAVGGGLASGGSMQGVTAPLLFHGTVILPSGYDFTGRMPGNVLLVLEAR